MLKGIAKATLFGYGWKQRAVVFSTTLATIFLFYGIGFVLDRLLETGPLFQVIAVLCSFPVTQYLLYRFLVKKNLS